MYFFKHSYQVITVLQKLEVRMPPSIIHSILLMLCYTLTLLLYVKLR